MVKYCMISSWLLIIAFPLVEIINTESFPDKGNVIKRRMKGGLTLSLVVLQSPNCFSGFRGKQFLLKYDQQTSV